MSVTGQIAGEHAVTVREIGDVIGGTSWGIQGLTLK
jgi:hypothetical protein